MTMILQFEPIIPRLPGSPARLQLGEKIPPKVKIEALPGFLKYSGLINISMANSSATDGADLDFRFYIDVTMTGSTYNQLYEDLTVMGTGI